jgi:hypothetical protein
MESDCGKDVFDTDGALLPYSARLNVQAFLQAYGFTCQVAPINDKSSWVFCILPPVRRHEATAARADVSINIYIDLKQGMDV